LFTIISFIRIIPSKCFSENSSMFRIPHKDCKNNSIEIKSKSFQTKKSEKKWRTTIWGEFLKESQPKASKTRSVISHSIAQSKIRLICIHRTKLSVEERPKDPAAFGRTQGNQWIAKRITQKWMESLAQKAERQREDFRNQIDAEQRPKHRTQ
jgi:hypothetical protein